MLTDIIKIKLTKKQHDVISKGIENYYDRLSALTPELRKDFFEKALFNQPIDFEKEIDGTVYSVKTFFNAQAKESVQEKMIRILGLNGKEVDKFIESD